MARWEVETGGPREACGIASPLSTALNNREPTEVVHCTPRVWGWRNGGRVWGGWDELLIFQADQLLILLLNYFFFNFVMWNLVLERRKELRAVK